MNNENLVSSVYEITKNCTHNSVGYLLNTLIAAKDPSIDKALFSRTQNYVDYIMIMHGIVDIDIIPENYRAPIMHFYRETLKRDLELDYLMWRVMIVGKDLTDQETIDMIRTDFNKIAIISTYHRNNTKQLYKWFGVNLGGISPYDYIHELQHQFSESYRLIFEERFQ